MLARQAHPQVSKADFDLVEIVLLHDFREPVDGDRRQQGFAQTRRFAGRTASSFRFARAGRGVLGNNWNFVYLADPGKESAIYAAVHARRADTLKS